MKFGQLKEYNMGENAYTECDGETNLKSLSAKLKLSIEFYTVCFYCIASWELSKYIETRLQTTCFYLILSTF